MRKQKAEIPRVQTRRRVIVALSWYSIAIHRGIARYARDAGWILDGGFVRSGTLSSPARCDGAIGVFGIHEDVDRQLLACGAPVVNIGYREIAGVARIASDSEAVGRLAAEHLISRGFKNFAFFRYGKPNSAPVRQWGFEASLRERGHRAHIIGAEEVEAYEKRNDIFALFGKQLVELPKPVAVFGEFDDRALMVVDAALLAGLRVPEQVAVLGVGNDELRCPFGAVPLSSIDNDEELIGYEAARTLEGVMGGEAPPEAPLLIPPRRVIVRQSTNILAIQHEHVATALKMIWEHYREPIDAVRVAAEIPLSYPQLHVSFVKHVGRSIADEIERLRIEHAQQLLITTESKLSEVAHRSGFGSADRMGRVFVRQLKVSPSEYRRTMQGASSTPAAEPVGTARPAAFDQP